MSLKMMTLAVIFLTTAVTVIAANGGGFDPFSSSGNQAQSGKEDGPVVSQVELNDSEISTAFQIVSDSTGWSIFCSDEVSKAKVSLWAKNISARDLLDKVVMLAGFVYHEENNVITVMTYEQYALHYGLEKKVVKLNYASADSIEEVIKPLLTTVGKSVVYKESNTIVFYDSPANIKVISGLIESLDEDIEPDTKNYQFTYVDAAEVFDGIQQILNLETNRSVGKATDNQREGLVLVERTNSIVLTAPAAVQKVMASIVENIDRPGRYEAGTIRVYKLENADVDEAASTIKALIEEDAKGDEKKEDVKFSQGSSIGSNSAGGKTAVTEEFVPQVQCRVTVSKSTNSVIVQATERQHQELEKLISELDERRRQVLIEAMIVEVTTSDDLSAGVELSHAAGDIISFSSFGLSAGLDPVNAERKITVSPGGTAAVLRPDKVSAILQFLESKGKVRISSSPQILVNDNAVGFINSIAEEPTTQTNQGPTTTTTSFAGFVEAGTQFAITPHISRKGYLRVEYKITLNSFGAKPTDPSIPPPRNTSSIESEATVPAGYTIVVGGLENSEESEKVDKVPILGDIPILGWAFRNTSTGKQYKTTYLFIRPRIMDSEDFSDLKDMSEERLKKVDSDGNVRIGAAQ